MRWYAAVWAGLVSLPLASVAQDVIYSQPGPGGTYQRYEQYGYGKDARVRLRSSTAALVPTRYVVVDPWTGLMRPVFGRATVNEEHERLGPAPAFGTFGGRLVNSRGPDPAGLYRSLGPGTQGSGRVTTTLPPGALQAPSAAVDPPAGARVRVEGAAPGSAPVPVPAPAPATPPSAPAPVPPPLAVDPNLAPPPPVPPPPPAPRLGRE
ncbi:MAG: hypothetical protein KatS3mg108_0158 [Isosphaeraceae bacterium]|jgi:hypothetical protein|nr:MAG: hypothetical protein KatS3mg108_0158 [Isosphaeraceae bacterium]